MSYSDIQPLFPYAGGKRRSLRYISKYLKFAHTYVEQFFGAGAVYCHMINLGLAKRFIINEKRKDIAGIYLAIRDDHEGFAEEVLDLLAQYRTLSPGQQEAMFVEYRDGIKTKYNAAQCLFVRKADFSSITRDDDNGNYDGMSGHMRDPNKTRNIDENQIFFWKNALDRTEINCVYFDRLPTSYDDANVFCDPPYYSSQISYGSFTKNDQICCLNWCETIGRNRNTCVMLSNRDQGQFFSKRVGSDVEKIVIPKLYTAGRKNVVTDEALFIWNRKGR